MPCVYRSTRLSRDFYNLFVCGTPLLSLSRFYEILQFHKIYKILTPSTVHSNKIYLKYPVFSHANINETGYWFVQIDGIPNIISLDAGIQYKYRYTKPLIMDPLEPVEDRLARVRRENEYNKAHQQEFEKVHMLPIEKMYEVPGTPKWLSVSNTWKINSTLPFYNITNFHLLMKIEVKKPVKKFWLTWCFQRPMKESEMPKCSVPGSHPSFCRDVY